MKSQLEKAWEFAREKHIGQKYGEHDYIYHLEQVYNMTVQMNLSEDSQIVAILHDILEDTNATYEELFNEFGKYITENIGILTRDKNMNYYNYLSRIVLSARFIDQCSIAKQVKTCDVLCNLQESILTGKKSLIKKYQKALFCLAIN